MINSELLTEIGMDQVGRFVNDPNFGIEEKYNGERRTICKDASGIRDFNREGGTGKGLPTQILEVLRNHPLNQFVIDVEFEQGKLVILDALILGSTQLFFNKYKHRKAAAHKYFDNYNSLIKVSETIIGRAAKAAFLMACGERNAEGVVFKDLNAFFKQGRSNQHFKLKFWKDLDAVVMAPSRKGHNSVEVGVYNAQGKLVRICGCSLNGKPSVQIGNVIKMEYLYGTKKIDRGQVVIEVVQPNLVEVRYDKAARTCTIDQIVINKNFA